MASVAAAAQCSLQAVRAGASARRTSQQPNLHAGAYSGLSKPATLRHQRRSSSQNSRNRSLVVAAAAQAEVGKLISRVEIPAFIPRADLLDQLLRWAFIEVQESGVANVGAPCKVSTFKRDDEVWGFTVSFLKDGESAADIRVAFDEEVALKHDWIGKGSDGMPVLEGNAEEIVGKHLEIRKVCDRSISENIRSAIREFCQLLVSSVNRYYAFGSCFVDDST